MSAMWLAARYPKRPSDLLQEAPRICLRATGDQRIAEIFARGTASCQDEPLGPFEFRVVGGATRGNFDAAR
jgi:hypothetical protein